MRKSPLVVPTLAFAAGIIAQNYELDLTWIGGLGVLFFSLWWAMKNRFPLSRNYLREMGILTCWMILGGSWGGLATNEGEQKPHNASTASLPDQEVHLLAELTQGIRPNQYGGHAQIQILAWQQARNWTSVDIPTVAYFSPSIAEYELTRFDTVLLQGKIGELNTRNEGYRNYLHQEGIYLQLQKIEIKAIRKGKTIQARMAQIQQKIGKTLDLEMEDATLSGIARAMFLGDKRFLSSETKAVFSTAGLSHILAISGMHVGIVVILLGFFRHFFRRASWLGRLTDVGLLALLGLYVMLTGAGPAVVRAGLMFGIFLLARMQYWRIKALNVLAISALLQLSFQPSILFSAGFQLSYLAVWALLTLYPRFSDWAKTPYRWLNYLYDLLGVSLVASFATAPLVYAYFGSLPTYFLISNLLTGPIMFLLVASGFLAVCACGLIPDWASPFVWVGEQGLTLLHEIARWISGLPHANLQFEGHYQPALGMVIMQISCTGLLLLAPKVFPPLQKRIRRWAFS